MNSINSELIRLGVIKAKETQHSERKACERKPKWRYHSCKELIAVQGAEAHNFQFGPPETADTTSIIYSSKECSSARILVSHFHCDDREQWQTTVIPINFCPFCGEKLKE